ncbi:MAG: HIT family protein [Parachlamydiaceae bacterium]|nr:HIT family protein [Parachlamydiaceae bacterium]
MNKKPLYFLAVLSCLIGSLYFYFNTTHELFFDECAFCDQKVLIRQKFYEDDLVIALYTHKPIFPGHCLIIPKRHVERFEMLNEEEISQMGRVIKKVNVAASNVFGTSSYILLQKNGLEVGQSVPHVHFHYIPRRTGHNSTLKFLIKMYIANVQNPLSRAEMQKVVEQMKKAIESDDINR